MAGRSRAIRLAAAGLAAVAALAVASAAAASVFDGRAPGAPLLAAGSTPVTVTLTLHDTDHASVSSVTYGRSVHPRVAVTAKLGTPTGLLNIRLYANGSCTGALPFDEALGVPLVAGVADAKDAFSRTLNPGTFSYKATYAGDATFAAGTSGCVVLTVTKAAPDLFVNIHDAQHGDVGTHELGPTLHPIAGVSSDAGAAPSGTITFARYADKSCTTPITSTGAMALSGGEVHATGFTYKPALPEVVAYKATYSGDTRYLTASGCDSATIVKVVPTVTASFTTSSGATVGTVVAGQSYTASMAVAQADGVAPPTGLGTIELFGSADCTSSLLGSVSAAIESGGPTSPGAGQPRTISLKATYAGDSHYGSRASSCQVLKIIPAETTMTVALHGPSHQVLGSVPANTTVHLRVVFDQGDSDTFVPVGTADVTFYTGDDCRSAVAASYPGLTLDGDIGAGQSVLDVATANSSQSPGVHAFKVEFNGDANFSRLVGDCTTYTVLEPGATPPPATPGPSQGASAGPSGSASAGASAGPSGAAGSPGSSVDPAASLLPGSSQLPISSTGAVDTGSAVGSGNPGSNGQPGNAGTSGDGPGGLVIVVVIALLAVLGSGLIIRGRRARA